MEKLDRADRAFHLLARDPAFARLVQYWEIMRPYIRVPESGADVEAAGNLIDLMAQAESKEELKLYLEGIDCFKLFTIPYLRLIMLYPDDDITKQKALSLNLIRRKT